MICIQEAILVEGKYDKNKLSQIVSSPVFETSGFQIINDHQKLEFLKKLASTCGLVVLTDSDGAGLVIRNCIKSKIQTGRVLHAYIPNIKGKEKRKQHASKEGFLGVEGMTAKTIIDALRHSGAHFLDEDSCRSVATITHYDLYRLGITGSQNSAAKRLVLKKRFSLPENIGTKALLDALNIITTIDELETILKNP